jgi:hypothetical protein
MVGPLEEAVPMVLHEPLMRQQKNDIVEVVEVVDEQTPHEPLTMAVLAEYHDVDEVVDEPLEMVQMAEQAVLVVVVRFEFILSLHYHNMSIIHLQHTR